MCIRDRSGLAAIIYVLVTSHWLANYLIGVTVIIYAGLYILLKAITRGMTVGYLLMGIRFINVRTKQVVTLQEYLQYVKKSTKMEIRYSQIFRYYLNYDGRLVQNEPMKKFGMVLCDSKKYKKFLKEYNYNQKQYNMLLQQMA
jgi:hypothetical protein